MSYKSFYHFILITRPADEDQDQDMPATQWYEEAEPPAPAADGGADDAGDASRPGHEGPSEEAPAQNT